MTNEEWIKRLHEMSKQYFDPAITSTECLELAQLLEPPGKPQLIPAVLPSSSDERKHIPLASGLLDYFPAALAAVASLSRVGNEQHNPGQPLHWARSKSTDHADCIMRHLTDRGLLDSDGIRHSAKVAWRALALLQEELEREEGAPAPRGAQLPLSVEKSPAPSSEVPSPAPVVRLCSNCRWNQKSPEYSPHCRGCVHYNLWDAK